MYGSGSFSAWNQEPYHFDPGLPFPSTLLPTTQKHVHPQSNPQTEHDSPAEDSVLSRGTPSWSLPCTQGLLEGFLAGCRIAHGTVLHGHPIGQLRAGRYVAQEERPKSSPTEGPTAEGQWKEETPSKNMDDEWRPIGIVRGRGAPLVPRPAPEEAVTWFSTKSDDELNIIYSTVENILRSREKSKSPYNLRARMRQILTDEEAEALIWSSDKQKQKIASKFRVNEVRAPDWFRVLPAPIRADLYEVYHRIFGTGKASARRYLYALHSLAEGYARLLKDNTSCTLDIQKELSIRTHLLKLIEELEKGKTLPMSKQAQEAPNAPAGPTEEARVERAAHEA